MRRRLIAFDKTEDRPRWKREVSPPFPPIGGHFFVGKQDEGAFGKSFAAFGFMTFSQNSNDSAGICWVWIAVATPPKPEYPDI